MSINLSKTKTHPASKLVQRCGALSSNIDTYGNAYTHGVGMPGTKAEKTRHAEGYPTTMYVCMLCGGNAVRGTQARASDRWRVPDSPSVTFHQTNPRANTERIQKSPLIKRIVKSIIKIITNGGCGSQDSLSPGTTSTPLSFGSSKISSEQQQQCVAGEIKVSRKKAAVTRRRHYPTRCIGHESMTTTLVHGPHAAA